MLGRMPLEVETAPVGLNLGLSLSASGMSLGGGTRVIFFIPIAIIDNESKINVWGPRSDSMAASCCVTQPVMPLLASQAGNAGSYCTFAELVDQVEKSIHG